MWLRGDRGYLTNPTNAEVGEFYQQDPGAYESIASHPTINMAALPSESRGKALRWPPEENEELKLLEQERAETREREQPQLRCRINSFGDRNAVVFVDYVDGSRPASDIAVLLQGRGNWYAGSRPGALYPNEPAPPITANASAPATTITGTFPEFEADQITNQEGCWGGVAWTGVDGQRRRRGSRFDGTRRPVGGPLTGVVPD